MTTGLMKLYEILDYNNTKVLEFSSQWCNVGHKTELYQMNTFYSCHCVFDVASSKGGPGHLRKITAFILLEMLGH